MKNIYRFHRKTFRIYYILLIAIILFFSGTVQSAQFVLSNDSICSILIPQEAPKTVKLAAEELKNYLNLSLGLDLRVNTEPTINNCIISLGVTNMALNNGIDLQGLDYDGYKIHVQKNALYILGIDTKDGHRTPRGGMSQGTLYGVYEFLEKYLGIRWLSPGEIGEYIPTIKSKSLNIVEGGVTYNPVFKSRKLVYVQNRDPYVKEWLLRNRQGYSTQLEHHHSFKSNITPQYFKHNQEWFPLVGGKRIYPSGNYKLETTNPELVSEFSKNIVRKILNSQGQYSFSISPSDEGGWSESKETNSLLDKDPDGKISRTKLVLKFYNSVAQHVSHYYPDKLLCGYIYADYLFPPSDGIPNLENNLCLVIAPRISYGYGLYKEKSKTDLVDILSKWAESSNTLVYYDLPTIFFHNTYGAPIPLGQEILQFLYPYLASIGIEGVYIYGVEGWGQGAINNYILAKLNWNPYLNAKLIKSEYIIAAYGQDIAPLIEELYTILDRNTKQYANRHPQYREKITELGFKKIYKDAIPIMEKIVQHRSPNVPQSKQQIRLELFVRNLKYLYKHLLSLSVIKDNKQSVLYENIIDIYESDNYRKLYDPYDAQPNYQNYKLPYVNVSNSIEQRKVISGTKKNVYRGSMRYVVKTVTLDRLRISLAGYRLFGEVVKIRVFDQHGIKLAESTAGIKNEIIDIKVEGKDYLIVETKADLASYTIDFDNAEYAVDASYISDGIHLYKKMTPLYFFNNKNLQKFSILLKTNNELENIAATIIDPDGNKVAELDTSEKLIDRVEIEDSNGATGIWSVIWKKPKIGVVDDVWIKFDDSLSPWVLTQLHDNTTVFSDCNLCMTR